MSRACFVNGKYVVAEMSAHERLWICGTLVNHGVKQ